MNSSDQSRFDEQLRRQLDGFTPAPVPEPAGWNSLRAKLPPPSPPGLGTRLRPFAAGVVVGGLLLWGGGRLTTTEGPAARPAPVTQAVTAPAPAPVAVAVTPPAAKPAGAVVVVPPVQASTAPARLSRQLPPTAPLLPATVTSPARVRPAAGGLVPSAGSGRVMPLVGVVSTGTDSSRTTPPAVASEAPTPAWTRALTLAAAIRHTALTPTTDTGRTERLRRLLAAQTEALAALQQNLDSLKQSLPEAPPALLVVADSAQATRPALADWRTLPAPRSPWAVAALLETTPSWSVLPTATTGVDQERTQASLAQSVQLQRALGPRWRARAGAGQATVRTQARYTSDRLVTTTHRDSALTTTYVLHEGTRIIRIINNNTHDTTYAQVQTYDTVTTHTKVVTYRTETLRDFRQQLFRPEYRFWTMPFSAQYLVVNRNRWSLGVSVGGQVTVFRGGSRPVWNGETYAMQRVSATQGPYRPVSVSVSGGLEAQYRLTPRLSAVLAPTVRWWAVQPGKGNNATRALLPAAQLGLSYGF